MVPITLLTAQKLADLLTAATAIETEVSSLSADNGVSLPILPASQVYVSSSPVTMAELLEELAYPRVSVFSSKLTNSQVEKFRSLSGTVAVTAEIVATADLVSDLDLWIHYYAEAVSNILRRNSGDWGDGVFFSGAYEIDVQPPRTGAGGYIQIAHVNCSAGVSRN
jgi:hypothetical protein